MRGGLQCSPRTRYAPFVLLVMLLAFSQSTTTFRLHPSFFDDFDLQEERDEDSYKIRPDGSRGSRGVRSQAGSGSNLQASDVVLPDRCVCVCVYENEYCVRLTGACVYACMYVIN